MASADHITRSSTGPTLGGNRFIEIPVALNARLSRAAQRIAIRASELKPAREQPCQDDQENNRYDNDA